MEIKCSDVAFHRIWVREPECSHTEDHTFSPAHTNTQVHSQTQRAYYHCCITVISYHLFESVQASLVMVSPSLSVSLQQTYMCKVFLTFIFPTEDTDTDWYDGLKCRIENRDVGQNFKRSLAVKLQSLCTTLSYIFQPKWSCKYIKESPFFSPRFLSECRGGGGDDKKREIVLNFSPDLARTAAMN